jgi:hypothetical protein
VWVKGGELLHDFRVYGGEGKVLQAACSRTDVAGLQEGMHADRKRAVRGRRVATLSEDAVSEAGLADSCSSGGWRIRLCSLKSHENATVLPFAWAHCEAGGRKPE